ncbi:MAG: DNA mismatch repair endonuclease MutL, partial [Chloroflexota bacterium]|nr:DNA mismatch repair endonuclease MutL [Chloroflexota bacterium]
MPIRRLTPAVAARIAAGEVIERPASVVKELVENALDAGARRVTIDLAGGGLDEIVIADDGHGIAPDDQPLAFVRHATSKLETDVDLERVATLGFRGEALASIAAVADVDLLTRTADNPHAWLVTVRSGQAEAAVAATRAVGTTVTVRGLFAELPARRKFLRGRSAEAGQVTNLVSALALAFPEVSFRLRAEGRWLVETPGDGDLVAAVVAVHGRSVAGYLVRVAPDEDERARTIVDGCLGWGEATLPTRAGITLLVNRRWVQSRALSFAVDEAYRSLIPVGRYPIAMIDITVPSHEVDVNVHPRKSEVRLLHERAVFAAVQRAIRRTLAGVGGPRPTTLLTPEPASAAREDAGWTSGLKVLGQAGGTYIIAEGAAGLYLVDQHAAHERILAEELHAAWDGRGEQQALLEPAI